MNAVSRQISPHAARLRRDQTDVEQRLWMVVRGRRLGGFKLRRQATIGPYVVDFLCVEARLVIELDGGQHDEDRDAAPTRYLQAQGYEVIRFWNHDLVAHFEGVLEAILAALERRTAWKRKEEPSPNPLPQGRERA